MADPFSKLQFLSSAANPSGFIRDGLPQIAFAGRSNVGKSSVINRVAQRKNLARVGNTPGKTSQINYFLIPDRAYLVDLPGYGFANVSKSERERWAALMEAYFASGLVSSGVMIVDARHKPTANDVTMAEWFVSANCPAAVVANKLDKLKKSEIEPNLRLIRETLPFPPSTPIVPFSAEKGSGMEELRAILDAFIDI